MKYKHRISENRVKESGNAYPVISITGPRQSGKTTLSKHVFPDYVYTNLEYVDVRVFAETDPRGFLLQSKNMIIDEAQKVPDLFSYIQAISDEHTNNRYVVTGSNNFLLNRKIKQSLAGRVSNYTILPFTFDEIGEYIKKEDLQTVLYNGFYPRVLVDQFAPNEWYKEYINTYLQKDVQDILNVKDMNVFYKFIQVLATMSGNLLNYRQLASEVDVSINTIKSWLSILEQSYIVFLLQPYDNNLKKTLIKTPKIYFYDVGLLSVLLKLNTKQDVSKSLFFGQLFENLIIAEFQKRNLMQKGNSVLYYYRDYSNKEIDLMVIDGNTVDLYEIKSSKVYDKKFSDNIRSFDKGVGVIKSMNIVYGGDISMKDMDVDVVSWRRV